MTWLGLPRIDLIECGSTNDEAARRARAGATHGTIVVAERQTSGRGRDGHAWSSPPGGLYLSIVLRPALALADVPPLTLAIGIALCDAVRAAGAAAQLKWPNDLLCDGKKLAGVLVEAQSQGKRLESVIVGIGVNLGTTPAEVAATGTSLDAPRERMIELLVPQLERWIDRYVAGGLAAIVPAWRERMAPGLIVRAQPIGSDGAVVVGELDGLDLDGALLLRDRVGAIHRIRSGDVEIVKDVKL